MSPLLYFLREFHRPSLSANIIQKQSHIASDRVMHYELIYDSRLDLKTSTFVHDVTPYEATSGDFGGKLVKG